MTTISTNFDMERIIQPVYEVFSKYKINQPIESCPCCYRPDETDILSIKDLKSLTVEDIGRYPHKAMTTWGDDQDFKYLLPRMLELEVYSSPYSFYYIPSKLELAEFKNWPDLEKTTLITFFCHYFLYLITLNQGYWAEDFVEEIRNLFPDFLLNDTEILNNLKKISYHLLDYNTAVQNDDNDYFIIIYKVFGEDAAIEYILNWPEDTESMLKFSKLINTFLYNPCITTPRTRDKLKRIQLFLESYWFEHEGKCDPIISDGISKAIFAMDYLI